MKDRIINSLPAPYPETTTPEINAVLTFSNILDRSRVIPDTKFLDKIPNTDGVVEVIDSKRIPIGKMEVQIKVLERKNLDVPKYQCKPDFLAFCEQSILPVLLIVVDTVNSVAYWHHINASTLTTLAKKIKKNTVSLAFDKTNIIRKDESLYVEKWTEIIEEYQKKLFDYDKMEETTRLLEKELGVFKNISNTAIGKIDAMYKEIHLFLDFYNQLLDNDFITIKNVLYPNYWKIGIGINTYHEESVNFLLYPIHYDLNDVQIKQFESHEQFFSQNFLSLRGHSSENPIKRRPRQYAYELIEKNAQNVLNTQPFFVKDSFFAAEYIFAFIDKFSLLLGLEKQSNEYKLLEIEFALSEFVPLWLEYGIDKSEYDSDPMRPLHFLIDVILDGWNSDDIKKVSEAVKEAIKAGRRSSLSVKVASSSFVVDNVLSLVQYLKQTGTHSVVRPYCLKNKINRASYYNWEAWGENKTVQNLKMFYANLPRIYDQLVETYFPLLKQELQFYSEFSLLIICVDFSEVAVNHIPTIEYYYLKSDLHEKNEVIVYGPHEYSVVNRENFRNCFKKGCEVDGVTYRLTECSFGLIGSFHDASKIYHRTPILKSANALLDKRLTKYFEKMKGKK